MAPYGKWFLNTNKFLIKPFLIVKFDCIKEATVGWRYQLPAGGSASPH